jgi:hypothetical protein
MDPCNTSATLVSQELKPARCGTLQSAPSPPPAPSVITSPREPCLASLLKAVSEPTFGGHRDGYKPLSYQTMLVLT